MVYTDAFDTDTSLGCVLLQWGKVVAYTSHQLKPSKKIYSILDLELTTIIFVLKIWRCYL